MVILISEPQIPKSCPVFDIQLVADSTLVEMSFDAEVRWEFWNRLNIIYSGPEFFCVDHDIAKYRNILNQRVNISLLTSKLSYSLNINIISTLCLVRNNQYSGYIQ